MQNAPKLDLWLTIPYCSFGNRDALVELSRCGSSRRAPQTPETREVIMTDTQITRFNWRQSVANSPARYVPKPTE